MSNEAKHTPGPWVYSRSFHPGLSDYINIHQADNMRDMGSKGRVNPKSLANLRPGAPGSHGAGPASNAQLGRTSCLQ